jgi:peptidoglycan/xylan/chitin deacetylase (PgdA/CDA1 family)
MSTEKLIQALRDVLRAETEEAEARERHDGYDWGYHGYRWAEESRKAGEAFQAALDEAIDARVRAVLERYELVDRKDPR